MSNELLENQKMLSDGAAESRIENHTYPLLSGKEFLARTTKKELDAIFGVNTPSIAKPPQTPIVPPTETKPSSPPTAPIPIMTKIPPLNIQKNEPKNHPKIFRFVIGSFVSIITLIIIFYIWGGIIISSRGI